MATQTTVYKEASAFLGDVRIATVTDDIPLRYTFDDEYAAAVQYVLRAAPWRFATKTATLSTSGSAIAGFTLSHAKPADWRRTLAIFIHSGARECPIHCKEQDTKVYTRIASPIMRYIDNVGATEANWTEQFAKAVAAYLAFKASERDTGNSDKTKDMWALWQQCFAEAARLDAVPEDPWIQFQLDGSFYRGVRTCLEMGFWRFAMKTRLLTSTRGFEQMVNGNFTTTATWTAGTGWSIHSGAAHHAAGTAANVSQSYAFTAGLTYEVEYTVSNYEAGAVFFRFSGGTDVDGTARSADGTYIESAIALTGNATFAIRASADFVGTIDNVSLKQVIAAPRPSQGYTYAFDKPSDWDRTFHFYSALGTAGLGQDWDQIDFRDEIDAYDDTRRFHANEDPVVLRYVSTDGESASTWTDRFEQLALTYLQLDAAKRDPSTSGAALQARLLAFKDAEDKARTADDMTERPRVLNTGRLVRARTGFPGYRRTEQVW